MATHDEQCEGPDCRCFGRKLRTVQFGGEPSPQTVMERHREKDLPAYQRLRMNGLQPPGTKNCYELEQRAESQLEVQMGKLIDPKLLRRHQGEIAEGMYMARELETTPQDMRAWKDAAVGAEK